MTDQRQDVAERLHQWATREMQFTPQGKHVTAPMPTQRDFQDICRGNLLSVWQYVLQHVHPTQKVHTVKGNLTLKSQFSKSAAYKVKYQGDSKFSAEREGQLKKRRDLMAKVAAARTDIQHLNQSLDTLQTQVLSAEEQYQASCEELSKIQQKRALLSQFSRNCRADAARYGEYQKRLGARLEKCQSLESQPQSDRRYFSRQGGSHGARQGERTESPTLETACTKSVRDACAAIRVFLSQLLEGRFNNNPQALQLCKDRIWSDIEKVMSDNSPQDVLQSLATITMETSQDLRQAMANINISKDAEDLRFKYESGSPCRDLSGGQANQLLSVHQMIEEKQASHITTFMEAEKSRNRAWKLDKQLVELAAAIDAKLAAMFSGDPGALDLARKLFSTELEMAASAAALQCLRSLKDKLSESAASQGKLKEALYAKYQTIQDFKGLSEQKQNLIRVLVRQNMDAKKKLDDKQRELGRYMETKLCSHKAETVAMTTQLKDCVNREVEMFASMPLQLLQVTDLDSGESVPVCQLSINRLTDQSASAGGGVMQEILGVLKFPMYKAPECLLPYLTELKVEMADIQGILDSHRALGHYGNDPYGTGDEMGRDIIEHIQGLCQEVAANDEEQMKRLLPVLQKRLSEATTAMQHCSQSKQHVTDWWDQPAQHLTPWVKVDGQNMEKWLDRWTMMAKEIQTDK